ncbi:hypothetical protein R1flu_022516 [Riccia fluitans]|uniref:NmrA-like domain-containing protein n=1 Tax=Riccia fluitans TaxID=41844 RepID=A0ABD1XPE8_9MARC
MEPLQESPVAKSKILIIGATGRLGRHITKASAAAGHPTFLLIRRGTLKIPGPEKTAVLEDLRNLGTSILEGSLEDKSSLLNALKQVDVVISAVGHADQQFLLIEAIKEAGNIKKFYPTEYGTDFDRATCVPSLTPMKAKIQVRRAIEAAGIPYTIVANVAFASIFLAHFWHLEYESPPRDKVEFYGDGERRVPFVFEEDVAKYLIESVDDSRTLNKVLCVRPKLNFISPKQVVARWEKKLRHTLEKTYVTEEEMLKRLSEPDGPPLFDIYTPNLILALRYVIFVKGEMDLPLLPNEVEADELYPHVKYRTVEEFLDSCL